MKKLIDGLAIAVFASVVFTGTAFLQHESIAGTDKICYYDHLGSEVAMTVSADSMCPRAVEV